jgi:hypothetical protein
MKQYFVFDVHDMVYLSVVMDEREVEPNGGLMFCMEYMEQGYTDRHKKVLDRIQSTAMVGSRYAGEKFRA